MSRISGAAAGFLRRLRNVHEAKGHHVDASHFQASCPACAFTHHLSLSIWILGNGDMVVHCFECKDTLSIMQALDMEVADLEPKYVKEARLNLNIQRFVMRAVTDESPIIIAAAQKLAGGESLSELDHTCLLRAAHRIAGANEVIASLGKPQ